MKYILFALTFCLFIFGIGGCASISPTPAPLPTLTPDPLRQALAIQTDTPLTPALTLTSLLVPRVYIFENLGVVVQYEGTGPGDLAVSSSGNAFGWTRQDVGGNQPTRHGAVFVPALNLLGIRPIDANDPVALAVESSQERIVTGSFDGTIELWNARTGERDQVFGEVSGLPVGIALNRNETLIGVGARERNRSGSNSVTIWNRAEPNTPNTFPLPSAVTRVAFAPDTNALYFSTNRMNCDAGGGGVFAWEEKAEEPIEVFSAGGNAVIDFAVHPNGKAIASVGPNGAEPCTGQTVVSVWDAKTGQVLQVLSPYAAEENLDSSFFKVASVAFSPDGKRLAVGDGAGVLHIWDWERNQIITTFQVGSDPLVRLVWSADNVLFVQESSAYIRVFNAP